jgi:hypothetical protein
MILKRTYLQGKPAGITTHEVVDAPYALLEERTPGAQPLCAPARPWEGIRYRQDSREWVTAITSDVRREHPCRELHIDVRQSTPGALRSRLQQVTGERRAGSETLPQAVFLEDFRCFREGIAWDFNRCCWQRLPDWEKFTGRGDELALGGKSDAHRPASLAAECVSPCLRPFSIFARESQLREKRGARHRTKSSVSDIRTNARLMVDSRHPGLEDAAQTGVFRNLLGEISGSNRVNGGE